MIDKNHSDDPQAEDRSEEPELDLSLSPDSERTDNDQPADSPAEGLPGLAPEDDGGTFGLDAVDQSRDDLDHGGGGDPDDGFKPFYAAEAKRGGARRFLLFLVLVVLAAALAALAVDAFVKGAPYRIQCGTTALACFVLLGLLWKRTTLEAKAGLTSAALALALALTVIFPGHEPDFFGLAPGYVFPAFYALVLLTALAAVWLFRPKLHWLPLVLSLPIVFAALAPVLALIQGGSDLGRLLAGPSFMESWPAFVRSGWIMIQVALPLGFILLLILQSRVLFRPQYESHWGFVFGALCLLLAGAAGLIGLEQQRLPAYPPLSGVLERMVPAGAVVGPLPTPADETAVAATEPETAPEIAPETEIAPPPYAEETGPAEASPFAPPSGEEQSMTAGPETSIESDVTAEEEAAPEPDAASESDAALEADQGDAELAAPEETAEATAEPQPEEETTATIPTEPIEPEPEAAEPETPPDAASTAQMRRLRRRVDSLETDVRRLESRLWAQEQLIRTLLEILGRDLVDKRPRDMEEPSPLDEFEPPAAPRRPDDWYGPEEPPEPRLPNDGLFPEPSDPWSGPSRDYT